jgi:hypothetical protein
MKVKNYRDHRIFYTNLLKRSRYFIANYAKIDIFKETLGKQEIGYRFFEGVAAGTVMLGQPPASPIFDRYFDWEDVIIRMPVDVENIELIRATFARSSSIARKRAIRFTKLFLKFMVHCSLLIGFSSAPLLPCSLIPSP